MDPILYVMAIMGCTDGSDQCAEVRIEAPRYASIQACQAAMPSALRRNSDISYPVITASCRQNGPAVSDRLRAAGKPSPRS